MNFSYLSPRCTRKQPLDSDQSTVRMAHSRTENHLGAGMKAKLRDGPLSAKSRASRESLRAVILSNPSLFRRLQEEIRAKNLHTNTCIAEVLNSFLLEQVAMEHMQRRTESAHGVAGQSGSRTPADGRKKTPDYLSFTAATSEKRFATIGQQWTGVSTFHLAPRRENSKSKVEKGDELVTNLKTVLEYCTDKLSTALPQGSNNMMNGSVSRGTPKETAHLFSMKKESSQLSFRLGRDPGSSSGPGGVEWGQKQRRPGGLRLVGDRSQHLRVSLDSAVGGRDHVNLQSFRELSSESDLFKDEGSLRSVLQTALTHCEPIVRSPEGPRSAIEESLKNDGDKQAAPSHHAAKSNVKNWNMDRGVYMPPKVEEKISWVPDDSASVEENSSTQREQATLSRGAANIIFRNFDSKGSDSWSERDDEDAEEELSTEDVSRRRNAHSAKRRIRSTAA